MSSLRRRLLGCIGRLLFGPRPAPDDPAPSERLLPASPKAPAAELWVAGLLLAAALAGAAFVAVYADSAVGHTTQLLGVSLGLACAAIAAALLVVARRLVTSEEREGSYPPVEHEQAVADVEQILREAGEGFTRRRLLATTGTLAGGALGVALLAPVVSLGPAFDLAAFVASPWFRGRRLVGEDGAPLRASEIEEADFYTAYPEGGDRDELAAPLVLVRLPARSLRLPRGRAGWAPDGIVAYSKICTHAGCAISLYRTPTFAAVEPGPALVCPCHYSTFDPASGGTVIWGPAGRPLPQLPLAVTATGTLVAAGNFSGPVGPSWWGVRSRKPT